MSRAVLAAVAAGALLACASAAAHAQAGGEARLQALIEGGGLIVDPKLQVPLDGARTLSLVRVELAPGVTEPRHTHPGPEILYGLGGAGFVEIGGERVAIEPGTAVRVDAGRAKALSNPSASEPLSVLAVLALDPDEPALTTVD